MIKFTLLSIDAWRDDCGWTWNNWFEIERDIFLDETIVNSPRRLLKFMRSVCLSDASKGKISIDDDGYNIVFYYRNNQQPLYALCYGEHWEFNGL